MATAICAECKNPRKPIKYREGDEGFCSIGCLRESWSRQSALSARSRGLCPECMAKHKPKEPHVGWIVKPDSQPNG